MGVVVNNGVLSVSLNLANANCQYTQNINNVDEYNYYMKSTNRTERNQYINIITNNYSGTYLYDENYAADRYKAECFYIAQINPYHEIANTEIDIHAHINVQFFGGNPQDTLDCWYSAYTTDYDLSSLIDKADWSNHVNDDYYLNMFLLAQNAEGANINWIQQAEESPEQITPSGLDISAHDIHINGFDTLYLCYWVEININSDLVDTNQQMTTYINELTLEADVVAYATHVEVVDIPGLMFTILTMPFAFISQAFDLTLFAGTAYQINVSQLFLGLIGVAMLLWVLKIILGRADLGGLLDDANAKRQQLNSANRAKQRELNKHNEAMDRESKRHERAMKYNETHHTNRIKEGNKK